MQLAKEPNDYKALVQRGYDLCAAAYEKARQSEGDPELDSLKTRLGCLRHRWVACAEIQN